jgi:hypothetical protein
MVPPVGGEYFSHGRKEPQLIREELVATFQLSPRLLESGSLGVHG